MRIERLWAGETVAVFATGPSLVQSDVDFVRGKARVIAVNYAVDYAPWADVLYSSDRQFWPREKGRPAFKGVRYGIGSSVGKTNPFAGLPSISVLKNTGFDGLETDPGGLRNGRCSGYAALNLAVHFGAARILLLGYNLNAIGGRAHCYDDKPGVAQMPSLYPNWRRTFETLVEPLKSLGVEVLNCTEQSSLSAFQAKRLREVM